MGINNAVKYGRKHTRKNCGSAAPGFGCVATKKHTTKRYREGFHCLIPRKKSLLTSISNRDIAAVPSPANTHPLLHRQRSESPSHPRTMCKPRRRTTRTHVVVVDVTIWT